MRIKDFFVIEQKATERTFARVLISSVCSILLCMLCLVSATWAWFTAEVNNGENIIEIGYPKVAVQVNNGSFTSGEWLPAGSHTVSIAHGGEQDDFQQKSVLYVTLTLDGEHSVYKVLKGDNQYQLELPLELDAGCTLAWEVSWFAPANATELTENVLQLPDGEDQTAETTGTTEATEATGVTTVPTQED